MALDAATHGQVEEQPAEYQADDSADEQGLPVSGKPSRNVHCRLLAKIKM
jgi:hypothetical protein